jgi:hypothetical protein
MTSESTPLRVGIVGSGFGTAVHLPAFRAHERFTVIALASPTNAAKLARERSIPHAFSSCAEMLEGAEVDIVSVTSPPFQHHADVLTALARGKHVLCEKPFALTVGQAEEMDAAAQRSGCVCAMAFEFRYVPSLIAMRELIVNGHLGPLRRIEITNCNTKLRAAKETVPSSWWFDREKGGGIANAYMPHLFDQALWFAGRTPARSMGFVRTANPQRRHGNQTFVNTAGDGAFALLDFGEGFAASVNSDMTSVKDSSLLAVHGEARTVVSSGRSVHDLTTFAVDEEETAELTVRPSAHAKLAAVHPSVPFFMELLDDIARAIDGEANALPTFADGLAVQRCLEAIGY